MDMVPIPSQTAGPFLHLGLTDTRCVPCIAGPKIKGERVWLTIKVSDGDGTPVDDAVLEIWQANADGKYKHPDDWQEKSIEADWLGFGRMATEQDGTCKFETVRPGRVPGPGDRLQAPHLNLAIFARGMLRQLYTRIYFEGDPANSEDPVMGLIPPARRQTLLARRDGANPERWRFEVYLQGEQETVFFDV